LVLAVEHTLQPGGNMLPAGLAGRVQVEAVPDAGERVDRDGLEEACQMLERDEADVLVTWKFDRLHRNYVNSVLLRDRIRRAGKEIHYAQSRTVSGKTARERLPEDLQFIMAEIDADDILERTQNGKWLKIKAGKWVGLNKAPYGYLAVGRGRDVSLVIDAWQGEKEAQEVALAEVHRGQVPAIVLPALKEGNATALIVILVFIWYVYGDRDSGPLSTQQIADRLTALRIPSPADKIATHVHLKLRGYAEWGRTTITKMIREAAYKGTYYHFRTKMVNGRCIENPDRSTWAGVPVPSIVREELWEAANRKMDQGRTLSDRGAKYQYLLGRRVTCECGYKMRGLRTRRRNIRKYGTRKVYDYFHYHCPGRKGNRRFNHCDMPQIKVPDLDNRVWGWVKEEIANPAILRRKLEEIQEQQRQGQAGTVEKIAILNQHRAEIEEELRKLARLYTTDMPKHIVESMISEQSHKLQLVNNEVRKLEHEKETPLSTDTITSLVEFSYKLGEHLQAIEDNFEAKRVVIDSLDVKVRVVRKNGENWLELQCILRDDIVSLPLLQTKNTGS
jgi:hypothetical protein